MRGGMCTKHMKNTAVLTCPRNYHIDGAKCVKKGSAKPTFVCPPHAYQKGSKCEARQTVEAAVVCPHGFDYRPNGGCVKVHVSKKHAELCPKGFFKHKDGLCHRVTHIPAGLKCITGILKGKRCEVIEAHPAETRCAHGDELHNGACLKSHTKPPLAQCPKGYIHDAGACTRVIRIESEEVCAPPGVWTHGKCEQHITALADARCPKNYEVNSAGHCSRSSLAEVQFGCPKGYTLGDNGTCDEVHEHENAHVNLAKC